MAERPDLGITMEDATGLLPADLVDTLRSQLPDVAAHALDAVVADVPEYARTLSEDIRRTIQTAIRMALESFLGLLVTDPDPDRRLADARRGAYGLGRGEARAGRSAAALLSAYRIGARVSWREMSRPIVAAGTDATVVARYAELVFAYIDDLSAASVAGHTDELDATGRLRQQRREELGRALLASAPAPVVDDLAERAGWPLPTTLTAVLLPSARVHDTMPLLPAETLLLADDDDAAGPVSHVLLVPDAVLDRRRLLASLAGRDAVVGPARPRHEVASSLAVARRAREHVDPAGRDAIDTTEHLVTMTVAADTGALDDLRAATLAPFDGLPEDTAARLTETLRAWLLHLGRRGDVADFLHVHPQTVRYRMDQIKDHCGDLDDPAVVEALVVALATPRTRG